MTSSAGPRAIISSARSFSLYYRQLYLRPSARCLSTATYVPPAAAKQSPSTEKVPQKAAHRPRHDKPKNPNHMPKSQRPNAARESAAPQLSPSELSSVYGQELFVFRCDVNAVQIEAAMASYRQLRDVEVLTSNDIRDLAQALHTRFRTLPKKEKLLGYVKALIEDIKSSTAPAHPRASMHLLTLLKEMEEYALVRELWTWLVAQDSGACDQATYGAAIEALAAEGVPLSKLEDLYEEGLGRFGNTTVASMAKDTGEGVGLQLQQGIITARLLHGDWQKAYEAFDLCVRLHPNSVPPRIYEVFIYERPVREAFIVFLMACRAGSPPSILVLQSLLREVWKERRDFRAMLKLVTAFAGAGGRPNVFVCNILVGAAFGSFPASVLPEHPGYGKTYNIMMWLLRDLIGTFRKIGVEPSVATFNIIITIGGKMRRVDLVEAGVNELVNANLKPNAITYRTLLLAMGELGSIEQVQDAWNTLCESKKKLNDLLIFQDWQALIKACHAVDAVQFARTELEAAKLDIGWETYRKAVSFLQGLPDYINKENRIAKILDARFHEIKKFARLRADVDELDEIFSSDTLIDFSTTDESLFSIDEEPPKFPGLRETEIQKIYGRLSPQDLFAAANETSNEFKKNSIAWLQFENWKSVNRLLFEAQCFEQEKEQKMIRAMEDASELAIKEEKAAKKAVHWIESFWEEQGGRQRAAKLAKDIENQRKSRQERWRGAEMELRRALGE